VPFDLAQPNPADNDIYTSAATLLKFLADDE